MLTRQSVQTGGGQATGGFSQHATTSFDGRYIVFESTKIDLVPNDGSIVRDIFLRDRSANTTTRVSEKMGGGNANAASAQGVISSDGRWIAYRSNASDLVANDTNGVADIFVYDRLNGTTIRVNLKPDGSQSSMQCNNPSISGDGRFVVWDTKDVMTASDTNDDSDVYLRDRDGNNDGILDNGGETTTLISVSNSGQSVPGDSDLASISSDGDHIAFRTAALLVSADTTSQLDIYVRDLSNPSSAKTVRVSLDENGNQIPPGFGNGSHCESHGAISTDGRFVVWWNQAALVSGDNNDTSDVHLWDRDPDGNGAYDEGPIGGQLTLISQSSAGAIGNGPSFGPTLSGSGQKIVFCSQASNLVPSDTNGVDDIFLRDIRGQGSTRRLSVGSSGEANGSSDKPFISLDGSYSSFDSAASNLVANDTNNHIDVFLRSLAQLAQ